jgi:MoxR-like ATPase
MALDVIRHRLVLSYEALAENISSDDLLNRIFGAIPVPEIPLHERKYALSADPNYSISNA